VSSTPSERLERPTTLAGWVAVGALVAVGVVVGGPIGGVTTLVGLAVAWWRSSRAVAGLALVALVAAALLTVLEAPATGEAGDYLFDFALDRPLAAALGRIAGVLVVVAVALAATRERAPTSALTHKVEQPDA
jgi:MFS family permease